MTSTNLYPTAALRGGTLTIELFDATFNSETKRWTATDDTLTVPFRLDNNALADIEDAYGSIKGWQAEMERQPFTTIQRTLAIGTGLPERKIGAGLIQADMNKYVGRISLAFALANGVDPTKVLPVLAAIDEGADPKAAMIAAGLAEADPPKDQTQTTGDVPAGNGSENSGSSTSDL